MSQDNAQARAKDAAIAIGELERSELTLASGRKIAIWRLPPRVPESPVPIVISSGFGKTMSDLAPLAIYLAHNGFDVYRYDPLDHVGLSDGCMRDFTLTSAAESLEATCDWVRRSTGAPSVSVIAASLSVRVAYRLASESSGIASVISIVGVVDVRRTLERVLGIDFVVDPAPQALLEIDGREVWAPQFVDAAAEGDWFRVERTAREVRECHQPLVHFAARGDRWVNEEEVQAVFGGDQNGPRTIIPLLDTGHDVGRNLAVTRSLLLRVVEVSLRLVRGANAPAAREPAFSSVTRRSVLERRLQRNLIANGARHDEGQAGVGRVSDDVTATGTD